MKLRHYYLGLCVLGAILPYSQLVPWIATHGLDFPLLFGELFSTRVGGFFGLDVIVSAIVLVIFVLSEGRRLDVSPLWLPVLATLLVGVSLGFPLFLYMRQRKLDSLSA
jgi:Terpene cyclase DEP1